MFMSKTNIWLQNFSFFFSTKQKYHMSRKFCKNVQKLLVEVRFKIILNKDRLLLYPNFEEKKVFMDVFIHTFSICR